MLCINQPIYFFSRPLDTNTMVSPAVILFLVVSQLFSSSYGSPHSQEKRSSNLPGPLFSNPAFPPLPFLGDALRGANDAGIDLYNIQADILLGQNKLAESFSFFQIQDPVSFRSRLQVFGPFVTSIAQALVTDGLPPAFVNIAFSASGLKKMGVTQSIGDTFFDNGQFVDSASLGDPSTNNWIPAFQGNSIHGLLFVSAGSALEAQAELELYKGIFGNSIQEAYTLQGQARPGDQQGHEHFGFLDGISQPAVANFTMNPLPGQITVPLGSILLGEPGDVNASIRPSWAKDGSLLVFRQLQQLVPEFNSFLSANAIQGPGLSAQQGADLLGARMVGRWQSGAPVFLSPMADDPTLGQDNTRNNDFTYEAPGSNITSDQTLCPFAAHIRKSNPRADLNPIDTTHHFMRSAITYGPEVTPQESAQGTTTQNRGLAFVCYQSSLLNGFRFVQTKWENNVNFIFGKTDPTPGFDAINGQHAGQSRFTTGLNPFNSTQNTTIPIQFVQPLGGEYFFSPAINVLKSGFFM